MKIIVTGCWHVGKKLAGYDWKKDFDIAVSEVIERAHRADLLVYLGDLFDTGHPTPKDYALALEVLDAIDCPMFIMKGNHDENPGTEPDALEPLKHFRFREEVKLVREAGILGAKGKFFAFIPHQNDSKAKGTYGRSAQSLADSLMQGVREPVEDASGDVHSVSMLFTHVDISGMGHSTGETSQRVGVALRLEELQSLPFDVAVGHYHKPEHVQPNVYVPGSILPFDFSEVGIQKFCLTVDL